MMVRSMIIVGMTAAIIISMPLSISNVSTAATMIILPMVGGIRAMTIANVRGNGSGAASGREHGARQPRLRAVVSGSLGLAKFGRAQKLVAVISPHAGIGPADHTKRSACSTN